MVDLETVYAVSWSTAQQKVSVETLADMVRNNVEALHAGHAVDYVLVGASTDLQGMRALAAEYQALRQKGLLPKGVPLDDE